MRNMQRIVVWSIAAVIAVTVLIVLACAGQRGSLTQELEGTASGDMPHFDMPVILPVKGGAPETTPATGELHIDVGVTELPREPVVEDVIIVPVEGT